MNTTKISSARAEARSKFSAGYRPRLLSNGNTKLVKRGSIEQDWFITGLSLAPARLFKGYNVAAVMDEMPDRFLGHRVIDGDEHDLRFLDPNPVVVRLKPKGALARSGSPFVQRMVA